MALWTPAELTTALWLDASDASTITIATGVSNWADKSGLGRHFRQTVGGYQPALTTAGLNGLDVITFVASATNRLELYGDMGLTRNVSAAECYVVASMPTQYDTRDGAIISISNENSATINRFRFAQKSDKIQGGAFVSGYTGSYSATSRSFDRSGQQLCAMRVDFVTRVMSLDAGDTYNATTTFNITSGPSADANILRAWIGQDIVTNYRMHGYIAEIVFFDSTLSEANRQNVEGYLAHKWGRTADLSATHPYKTLAPTIGASSSYIEATTGEIGFSGATVEPDAYPFVETVAGLVEFAGAFPEVISFDAAIESFPHSYTFTISSPTPTDPAIFSDLHYAPVNIWPGYTSDGDNIVFPIAELPGLSVNEAGAVTGDWREIFQSVLLSLSDYMDWAKDNPISPYSRPQTLDIFVLEDWNRSTVSQMRRDIRVKFNIQYAVQKITEEPT